MASNPIAADSGYLIGEQDELRLCRLVAAMRGSAALVEGDGELSSDEYAATLHIWADFIEAIDDRAVFVPAGLGDDSDQ